MKKIILIIIVSAFLYAACQPTPEELIVQKKDGEQLMEIIQDSSAEESDDQELQEGDSQEDIATFLWQEEITSNNEKFSCVIDTEVILSHNIEYPVIEVSPYQFTASDIYNYLNIIAADAKLYIYGNGTPNIPMTKSEIETSLINLKLELNDPNSTLNQMKKRSIEQYEERKATTESEIAELEEMYESAPYEIDIEELEITEELMMQGFMATSKNELVEETSGITTTLKVSDCDVYDGRVNGVSIMMSTLRLDMTDMSDDFLMEDAIESAKILIGELGFSNMEYCYSAVSSNLFNVVFMRSYNGILTNYTEQDVEFDNPDIPSYSIGWANEKIIFKYNEYGILKGFIYQYPISEEDVLNSDVEILSFEGIQDIFRQQILNEGMWIENENTVSRTYYIDTIKLGMMRISMKDNIDEFMFVPVWDFYGYSVDSFNSQDDTDYALDENNEYVSYEYPYSFLTINAIDGSIIDREQGY